MGTGVGATFAVSLSLRHAPRRDSLLLRLRRELLGGARLAARRQGAVGADDPRRRHRRVDGDGDGVDRRRHSRPDRVDDRDRRPDDLLRDEGLVADADQSAGSAEVGAHPARSHDRRGRAHRVAAGDLVRGDLGAVVLARRVRRDPNAAWHRHGRRQRLHRDLRRRADERPVVHAGRARPWSRGRRRRRERRAEAVREHRPDRQADSHRRSPGARHRRVSAGVEHLPAARPGSPGDRARTACSIISS